MIAGDPVNKAVYLIYPAAPVPLMLVFKRLRFSYPRIAVPVNIPEKLVDPP
jgi:hypothetical protein